MWKNKITVFLNSILQLLEGNTYKLLEIPDWYRVTPDDVDKLVESGADVHLKDTKGKNLLACAAEGGAKPATLRHLHEKYGISADETDCDDCQPWKYAKNEICKNVLKGMRKNPSFMKICCKLKKPENCGCKIYT